ncbi:MAG: S8 family peptidase [Bacteroidales bacterium]|jgi:subtilisin family serine protease|nr:S8 family peptidase [Bacteroidales bacterium]
MKRIFIFLWLALGFATMSFGQQTLSPPTRAMLHNLSKVEKQGKTLSVEDTSFINSYGLVSIDNVVYASCFIRVNENFNEREFALLGGKMNPHEGNLATALIPVSQIENVAKIDGVVRIEIGEKVKLDLDAARTASNVNQVQAGTNGLSQAYKGDGVVVGIIDNGFDYTHPTFYDTTHSVYRVKRVWEQSTSGTNPSGFNYGRELTTQTTILAAQRDNTTSTHGSHVAGIAGGSGGATSATYRGVAPNSDLVFVATNMTTTGIADGISYIKSYAASVGKPCVINMSLGSNRGPNDGTSSFEQYCDQMATAGVIPCISAGNEGSDPLFATKTQTGVDTMNVAYDFVSGSAYNYVWGTPNNQFSVAVAIYNASTGAYVATTPFTQTSSSGYYNNTISYSGSSCGVTIWAESADPNNNKPNAMVSVNYSNTNSNYYVVIRVRSSAASGTTTSMWSGDVTFRTTAFNSTFTTGSTNQTINCLATGNNSIAVGAYATKLSYTSLGGSNYGYSGTVSDIAYFSSKGPSADGRTKPDIAGPGHTLVSSFNRFSSSSNPSSSSVVASQSFSGTTWYYGTASGTSMSSPFVAGVIALWLQANPSLTPSQVKTILQTTSITDSYTSSVPNNTWGYGKINALAGIQSALGTTAVVTYAATSVTANTATLNGAISSTQTITARGFQYKASTASSWQTIAATGTTTITANLTALTPSTTYTFRAYATVAGSTYYGEEQSFTTLCSSVTIFPYTEGFENGFGCWTLASSGAAANTYWQIVTTGVTPTCAPHGGSNMAKYASYDSQNQVGAWTTMASPQISLSGNMLLSFWFYKYTGSYSSANEGVYVYVNSTPDTVGGTLLGFVSNMGTAGWDSISYTIPSALSGTKYIVFKALSQYGYNMYLDDIAITQFITPPTVTTLAATSITQTTATLNGTTTAGTQTITARGFQYKVSTASSWQTIAATGTTTITANLTALTPNTSYTFRASATTASGTTYGSELTFTTQHTPPVITTLAASTITNTTATLNGTTAAGTQTITARGFQYKVSTASSWQTITATGTTTITANLTALTPNTSYTFRASATTASGTTYGSELTFSTTHTPPTVTTLATTAITNTTATLNGTTTAGTQTITARGFQYKVSTASSWQTITATGTTNITAALTSLTPNTSYTFRASATTASGATYGSEQTFTTLQHTPPTVTTLAATSITNTTATLNGTTAAGTETITARGFQYKVSTASSWQTITATGTTTITANLTALTPNTSYTFRASATTASGTTYGSEQTFTTLQHTPPTVTTLAATEITNTTATLNGTTAAGTETITARGFEYKVSTASSWQTIAATGTTDITANLTALTPNTSYTFKAYATTASGTTYGSELTFLMQGMNPVVVTDTATVTCVSDVVVYFAGTITNVGTPMATEFGFIYGTTAGLTVDNGTIAASNMPVVGTTMTATATGFNYGDNYFYVAYAKVGSVAYYGVEKQFTTCDGNGLSDVDIDAVAINIYPNPATHTATLSIAGLRDDAQITITDLTGKVIAKTDIKANQTILAIDVEHYAAGTYYVRILNNDINRTQKLIVNK